MWFFRICFLKFVDVFSLFPYYFPLEKGNSPSFEQNWIPITQGCFMPSLVEKAQLFLRRRFLKFVNVFSLFPHYPPLEKGVAFHLNKIEFPLPKDDLCQVWLKRPSGSLEDFQSSQCIFAISSLSPLDKGCGLSFEQNWIPITQGCFVPSLVEIGQMVLEK